MSFVSDYQFWTALGGFAIAGATIALTASTLRLARSSSRHEKLIEAQTKEIQTQTQTLSAPRIAIRGVTRLTDDNVVVRVRNVGLGPAEHVKVSVSWSGKTMELPEGRWFFLGPGQSRNLDFSLSEEIETINVRVDFTDLMGKELTNDLANAKVRRRYPKATVSRV